VSAIIIFVHVVVCLILCLVVLLQSGESADLAGAFGGAGSQTRLGGRGQTTLLSKVTTVSAIVFMLTSLGLWIVSAKGAHSVVGNERAPVETSAPASTAPATPEKKKQEPAAQQPAPKTAQKPAAATGSEPKK
jgi:preprotein translocase subunit SecG